MIRSNTGRFSAKPEISYGASNMSFQIKIIRIKEALKAAILEENSHL
jgi:hypothetical protein